MSGRVIQVAALLAVGVAAAGCGGGHGVLGARTTICTAGSQQAVGSDRIAWAAVVVRPTIAYRTPGGGQIAHFGRINVNGVPTVLGVVGEQLNSRCRAAWLHVQLPLRPNGATGWVRVRQVRRLPVHTRIVVDLTSRRVTLYRNNRFVLGSSAAIGSSATPTPVGRYYVNQRLIPS